VKSLAARTILGFTQLIVYLGAALFVPAWTLDFWQAWVYLSIFAAASVLIAAYLWKCDRKLLESRVKAGPLAEKEQRQKLIQLLASVAFIGTSVVFSRGIVLAQRSGTGTPVPSKTGARRNNDDRYDEVNGFRKALQIQSFNFATWMESADAHTRT
jgi:membrane protein implicated in regulation of membrane protease activity